MVIGKEFTIDSSHFLPGHPKCGDVHGHTWTIEVRLKGDVQADGFVIDFGDLKEYMRLLLVLLDHTSLNRTLTTPTCENLASWILRRLITTLAEKENLSAVGVKVREGNGGWAYATHPLNKEVLNASPSMET